MIDVYGKGYLQANKQIFLSTESGMLFCLSDLPQIPGFKIFLYVSMFISSPWSEAQWVERKNGFWVLPVD